MNTINMTADTTDSARLGPPPKAIPIESGLPILGNLLDMLRDAPGLLERAARNHSGQIFAIQLGPMILPVITRPEHVQEVLLDNARAFTKGPMFAASRDLIGDGLATSEGDLWRRQRRLMQPLFGQKHIATLGARMMASVEREVERLSCRTSEEGLIDIGVEMNQMTQRVLLESMFSTSLSTAMAADLVGHIQAAFAHANKRWFLYFLPQWVPLPGQRAYQRAIRAIDEAMASMVQARRQAEEPGDDLLARLLAATDAETGEGMSDRQLRDELVTLFIGGQETTAAALTWLFYLLDQHPDVDAKLRQEVAQVLGERSATVADLPQLGYTRCVIQEALRLYPPSLIIPRYAAAETTISGYRVPADTVLLMSPYLTHRDPALWERPLAFDPERFTKEREKDRPRFAYYPFGGGSRQCIGYHFAMMEAQFIVSRIVQRLRLRTAPGQKVTPTMVITLKPKHGIRMWAMGQRATAG